MVQVPLWYSFSNLCRCSSTLERLIRNQQMECSIPPAGSTRSLVAPYSILRTVRHRMMNSVMIGVTALAPRSC